MKDVELGPEERALVAAARDAVDPSEMQRARVRRGLSAKIASGMAAPVLVSSTAMATVLKIGVVVVTAAIGGDVAYVATGGLAHRNKTAATAMTSRPKPAPSAEVAIAPPSEPALPVPVASQPRDVPSHPRAVTHLREAAPATDLSGELDLLTRINAATHAGDANRAFDLLRTYDRTYPAGLLTQERAAAGIFAHCAAGQVKVARDEARRFFERWPRSPLVTRIRGSCAENDLR